jgi:O-antigen/teichoic acid export membrane protein
LTDTKKVVSDGIYIMIGSVIAFIFSYAFRILLTRTFSVEEYGLFYSIWTFITFFLFFLYLGLDTASTYYIVKYNVIKNYNEIKSVILTTLLFQTITSVIFIILIFIFSNFLEINYFNYEGSSYILRFFSIYLLFNVFNVINISILLGFQKMKHYSFYAPLQSALYFLITFFLIILDFGIYSPFWAYVLTSFILFLIFLPISQRIFPIYRYKFNNIKKTTCHLFSYGIPVILIAIGSRLIIQTDTLVLTKLSSMQGVGLYQSAMPIATAFTVLTTAITIVLFPLFTELWHKKDFNQINIYLKYIYHYLIAILLPIITISIIFSGEILNLVFGKDYFPAKMTLIILLSSVLFNIFSSINFQSLSAFGKPKLVSKIILSVALFNLIFNIILIPILGTSGAALSTVTSYLILYFVSQIYLKRIISFKVKLSKYIWLVLISLFLIASSYYFVPENIIIKLSFSLLYILIYYVYIYKTKFINFKEFKELILNFLFKNKVK